MKFFLTLLFCFHTLFAEVSLLFNNSSSIQSDEEYVLMRHIKSSLFNAEIGISKLQKKEVLLLDGMSSYKVRHFLNNLCSLPSSTYLEIGVWKGATFISALYGNEKSLIESTAIDNWSQFGGPEQIFLQNCSRFIGDIPFKYHNSDAFYLDCYTAFENPINIYFYSGGQSEGELRKAFTYYNTSFADRFIAVIDNWNWANIRTEVFATFSEREYEILYERALPAHYNSDRDEWWNGLYVALIRKKN